MKEIVFNQVYCPSNTLANLQEALESNHLSGDGKFSKLCHSWLSSHFASRGALLTTSGTAALELSALLLNLNEGDEVIMPSYTFTSTANAVALRNAKPVFVDIRPDTLNIDEGQIAGAITSKTRAIFVVHYAGVACNMEAINRIAAENGLSVVEDAAHAFGAKYREQPLGSLGQMAALSFHETKNLHSGEGGAFLTNDDELFSRAEILREKGTNRSQFFRGQVDKYTWVDLGSSFLPSELQAAVLWAQIEEEKYIQAQRMRVWNGYYRGLTDLESAGMLRRPVVPPDCTHNAHLFYILTRNLAERTELVQHMNKRGVSLLFHYIPLHSAPAGIRHGRIGSKLNITESTGDRLLRLPLHVGIEDDQINHIVSSIHEFYGMTYSQPLQRSSAKA